jgi:hypothetical protein
VKTKVTFFFEDELIADISEIARREHLSVRSIIRTFLRDLSKSVRERSAKDVLEKSDRSK